MNKSNYTAVYEELQGYLKSTDEDKDNVLSMLKRSEAWVKHRCGDFDINTHELGKDLVFNRVRFDFNGYLDHFESSFMSDLSNLSFELWGGDDDAETP